MTPKDSPRVFYIIENPNPFDIGPKLQALRHRPRCEHIRVIEHRAYEELQSGLEDEIKEYAKLELKYNKLESLLDEKDKIIQRLKEGLEVYASLPDSDALPVFKHTDNLKIPVNRIAKQTISEVAEMEGKENGKS
jgi:hypothetical protein